MIASATKNDGDVLISLERAGEMLGGISKILLAALWAALSGGVMAIGYLAIRAAYRRIRAGFGIKVPPVLTAEAKSAESIPYAPAITMGALLALVSEM